MIIAGPSETHAEMSLAALEQGKHVLVEIPIAMNLAGAEAVVAAAEERGLTLGVVHPMRYRTERLPIVERIPRGEEHVSHVQGRFFIHRLQNVGATGLQRSWTDNLLWHHTTHLIDFGLWVVTGGDLRPVPRNGSGGSQRLPADRRRAPASRWSWCWSSRPTTTRRSSAPGRTTRASTSTTRSWSPTGTATAPTSAAPP